MPPKRKLQNLSTTHIDAAIATDYLNADFSTIKRQKLTPNITKSAPLIDLDKLVSEAKPKNQTTKPLNSSSFSKTSSTFSKNPHSKYTLSTGIHVKQKLGQKKQLEKLQKKNTQAAQTAQDLQKIDEVDYLVRNRDDEIAITDKIEAKETNKVEKAEKRDENIQNTLQFMLDSFARVKKSNQLIKQGKEPLHEYDHFITYPMDIQAIVDKLGANEQLLASFEWLHNTRKMVWDLKNDGKTQKNNAKADPLQRVLNKGKQHDSSGFLQLRQINNNDLAYMAKQRSKVSRLERVLEKENKFIQLKDKLTERQQRNKKMLERTSGGQPVMKHRVKNLLAKISKSSSSF